MAKKAHKKEEVVVETIEESVVEPEPRELPEKTGEETSETVMQGGQMMRIVKVGDKVKYVPL